MHARLCPSDLNVDQRTRWIHSSTFGVDLSKTMLHILTISSAILISSRSDLIITLLQGAHDTVSKLSKRLLVVNLTQ